MNFAESVQMAVKTLTANKLRSVLTMLGIIIGNTSVISVIAIGEGAKHFIQQQLESIGPNQLTVYPGNQNLDSLSEESAEILLSDVEAIASQASSVTQVAPQITSTLQLSHQGLNSKATVMGTTPGMLYVRNLRVRHGRFFERVEQQQNARVASLGAAVAQKLFGKDNPLGKTLQINNLSFQVIGVMEPKGAFAGINYDDTVYTPITTAAERLIPRPSPRGISVNFLELAARDKASVRVAAFQVTNILTLRHGKKDFTIEANKSVQNLAAQVTNGISLVLTAIAGISLFVGGIGIMNIMLVSVTERTKEIGLRKAIGASKSAILSQFLIEAVILSVGGGLIGIGIGVSSAILVGVFTPLRPSLPPQAILLASGVSAGIGLLFGVAPAHRAAKLDPIEALRSN
jgi:putative ABC transport system permease protein